MDECDAVELALRESVRQSLSLLLFDNAKAICERLVASFNNESNIHLLALCYYQCNQSYRSYHILKGQQGPQSRYLFALSCMQMGKHNEAKEALTKRGNGQVPNGAAGHYLLGKICHLTGRLADAKDHLAHALTLDPLLWTAYEDLCSLGGDEQAGSLCSSISASYSSTVAALHQRRQAAIATVAGANDDDADEASEEVQDYEMGEAEEERETSREHEGFVNPSVPLPFSELTPISLNHPSSLHPASHNNPSGSALNLPPPPPSSSMWSAASSVAMARGAVAGGGGGLRGRGSFDPHSHSLNPDLSWVTPQATNPNPSLLPPPYPPHQPPTATTTAGGGGGARHPPPPPHPHLPTSQPPNLPPPQMRQPAKGARDLSFAYETPTLFGAGSVSGPGGGQLIMSHATPSNPAEDDHDSMRPGGGGGGGGGGRLKKVGVGKSLFHHDPTPVTHPPSHSNPLANTHSPSMSPGRAPGGSSSVRRSSRLAALASSASPPRADMKHHGTSPGHHPKGRVKGTGAGGGAMRILSHHDDSQNRPDPTNPPKFDLSQSLQQTMQQTDAKISKANLFPHNHHQQQTSPAMSPLLSFHIPKDHQHQGPPSPRTLGPSSIMSSEEARVLALGSTLLPLMEGVRHLSMYRSKEAMQSLARLPRQQYATSYVLHLVGKAHLERADYRQALASFDASRALDKSRVEGSEVHSTVLWHLGKVTELSLLAKEVQEMDRLSPSSWIVLGNLSSLQGDHDAAISSFTRATELDPSCAYGHTLRGHEHLAMEDYDKALECYRTAEGLDPRHYNAVYGSGQVYLRLENPEMAMSQFKRACLVNPQSSVLATFMAVAMVAQGMHERALAKIDVAIDLDPKNAMARFERSSILMAMDRHEEAMVELNRVLELTPAEHGVYLQMGKAFKAMGEMEKAQSVMETALGLASSSGANASEVSGIKIMIEKLGVLEGEEEEEEF